MSNLWSHLQVNCGDWDLGSRILGEKEALLPLYHQIWKMYKSLSIRSRHTLRIFFIKLYTYMLLNMLSKAVNAKPMANMDFILTRDRSLLLFFSLSSSRSIFFLCCLSKESPCASFLFSTKSEIVNLIYGLLKHLNKVLR